jgi:16S rRNA (cytosine967-C5)-methyltransferase
MPPPTFERDKRVDPREYAVLALDALDLPGLPTQAFKRQSGVLPDDPRDRALAERLVVATTKHLIYLSTLISHYAQRPYHRIEPRLRLILLVGIAQRELFDRVPDHALVNETVQQTRRFKEVGLSRSAGFVNAVMRRAVEREGLDELLPKRDQPIDFGEIVLSHPRPLVERLVKLLGPEDALRFCEHSNRQPPLLVRLIGPATIDDLKRDGVEVVPHEQAGLVVAEGASASAITDWSDRALAQPQDATAAGVVPLLDVQPGMTVLDRCCGVGTKTQQLCEAVGADGRVFAVDSHGKRISRLRALAKRRPFMQNLTAKRAEWSFDFPDDWPDEYDRILIDAPCSNSGVLARRPEARYAQADERELADVQASLLDDVWPLLKPGGRVVYSTCSVWPEENGRITTAFLEKTPNAQSVEEHTWLPSFHTDDPKQYRDGGYVCVIVKQV